MDPLTRLAATGLLMAAVLGLGFAVNLAGSTDTSTVAGLLDAYPTGERVALTANVTRLDDDYESEAGNTYQQFYISNGDRELLVFCNTREGRAVVARGDTVRVRGTFKEFQGTPEIYTGCDAIERMGK